MREVATFWEGPVSALEKACLMSFVNQGHDVTFYSFERPPLDAAIKWRSAQEILEREYLPRFITNGKTNIAHYADLFRLVLFQKTAATWVDCDVLALERSLTSWPAEVLVSEGNDHVINCVLRINNAKALGEAVRLTKEFLDRDVPWAATQYVIPKALNFSGQQPGLSLASEFSPLDADEWFKFLLPEFRDECMERTADARTIHLFNNILQKVGYHKDVAPPVGSYLHTVLQADDLLGHFTGVYSADTVRNLAEGWALRFSARQAGFGAIVRELLPSFRRTMARRSIR